MKKALTHRIPEIVLTVLTAFALVTECAVAQQSAATQTVLLQVNELNKIDLVGGPLILQISSINGDEGTLTPAVDANTKLLWTSNGDTRKIAVASNVASPRFVLKIAAEKSAGSGVAEPEVTLADNEPHDLILGVQKSAGSCQLKFTAVADPESGIGSETHLITYTITGG